MKSNAFLSVFITMMMPLFVMMLFVGCTEQQAVDDVSAERGVPDPSGEFRSLVEKAKWGDGQAYLRLADCYKEGKGVKKDFLGMLCMTALAYQYHAIDSLEVYFASMPEDSEFKILLEALGFHTHRLAAESDEIVGRLIHKGSPEGYSLKGMIALENGDTIEGEKLFKRAASQGSSFAEILLCLPDWRSSANPDIERLESLADEIPVANLILGKIYAGMDDIEPINEDMAVCYFLKADENAYLDMEGAQWLLSYYRRVGILPVKGDDILRLKVLAGECDEEESDCDY